MKRSFHTALALTCLLGAPGLLRSQMDPSMPGMPGMKSAPKPSTPTQKPKPAKRPGTPASEQPAPAASVPFGKVADGSPEPPSAPLPQTEVPLRLPASVQEQEHPQHRTGSGGTALPDLLADVKARTPQPLAFFTAKALAGNPTIRQAEAQVRRLQGEAKQQGLWANPEVGYEADHIRGGSYASGEQGGYLQQTIPLAGQRSSARAAVQQQVVGAEAALEKQRLRVTSSVEQAFYAALAAQAEVDLRQQLTQIAADAATTAHQLANVGQADAPDILQSEVEREQAALDYASAQREFLKAFTRLAAMSGDPSLQASPLAGDLTAVPQLPPMAAQTAVDTSPALRVADQSVKAGEAAVRSTRRQALPELTVHAGLQQDNEPLENARGRVGVVGVAQAGITLPLWKRNQGAVAAASASVQFARAEVDRTRLQLRSEAEQAAQDYSNARMQAERYRDELLPRAQRAYELYQQKYNTMAAAYPQVLVSQRTLFQLRIEYIRALGNAWQSAILLQHGLLTDGLQAPERIEVSR